jgi:hypothetical protein
MPDLPGGPGAVERVCPIGDNQGMTRTLETLPATSFPARPPIRLAFGVLFWRLMGLLTLLFALILTLAVFGRVPPGKRLAVFLFMMPGFAAVAFFLAATGTVLVDLAVRLIVRPRLLAWLAPKGDPMHADFHLEPRERVEAETSARVALGRAWAPGRLVLTDRRLMFLPNAWDVEPWSSPRGRVQGARWAEPPRAFWGLVRGIPPHLEIAVDNKIHRFALLDAPTWSHLVVGTADHAEPPSP